MPTKTAPRKKGAKTANAKKAAKVPAKKPTKAAKAPAKKPAKAAKASAKPAKAPAKNAAKAPAKAAKAPPKNAAKAAKGGAFASEVRAAVAKHWPALQFVETGGGSGPIVTFALPTKSKALKESVVFQKGLHGADWFRVNLFVSAVTDASNEAEFTIWQICPEPDRRWTDPTEMSALIEATAANLKQEATKVFAPFDKASAKLEKLFGGLTAHYAAWLDGVGRKLPPEAFVEDEETRVLTAFDSFKEALTKKKLFEGTPGELDTPLWQFWHGGRPMREEDYRDDDYYDCTRCNAFVRRKRARLVMQKDPHIGKRYELVCSKH